MSEIDYKDTSYLDIEADMMPKKEEIDKEARFVYDGKEVKLTGKRAKKKVKLEHSGKKLDIIYEIEVVGGVDWKHWVRLRELYKIEEF